MYKICVSDINILVSGADCPLFDSRLAQYAADFETPDVEVSFTIGGEIARPEGEICGKNGYRTWMKTERGFANYDELGAEKRCIALFEANESFSQVKAALCDIAELGGAPCSVRSFNMLGEIFRYAALCRGKCVIHASAVCLDGRAAAFSAPSGVGKSTHASLWEECFGAEVINDDSPAVGFENGRAVIYGTPWSGKTDKNRAVSAPLDVLFFLERADEPKALELPDAEKAFRIISQLPVPPCGGFADRYAEFAEKLIKEVPMYVFGCDISRRSAEAARRLLFLNAHEEQISE